QFDSKSDKTYVDSEIERLEQKDENITTLLEQITVNATHFGVKADGVTDDTLAIQDAIDYAESLGGGRVLLPNGTILVDAEGTGGLWQGKGVLMKDNVFLILNPQTTLKVIPNGNGNYKAVTFSNVKNSGISGGSILGDREQHTETGGSWASLISITGSENISVKDIELRDSW